jgi:hypothetical protein
VGSSRYDLAKAACRGAACVAHNPILAAAAPAASHNQRCRPRNFGQFQSHLQAIDLWALRTAISDSTDSKRRRNDYKPIAAMMTRTAMVITKTIRSKLKRCMRKAVPAAGLVGFLVNALVPVGYMPAALASGAPVRLCDSVLELPGNDTSSDTGAEHHHHDGHEQASEQWEHCKFGALSGAAPLAGADEITVPYFNDDYRFPSDGQGLLPVAERRANLVRAPPRFQ